MITFSSGVYIHTYIESPFYYFSKIFLWFYYTDYQEDTSSSRNRGKKNLLWSLCKIRIYKNKQNFCKCVVCLCWRYISTRHLLFFSFSLERDHSISWCCTDVVMKIIQHCRFSGIIQYAHNEKIYLMYQFLSYALWVDPSPSVLHLTRLSDPCNDQLPGIKLVDVVAANCWSLHKRSAACI